MALFRCLPDATVGVPPSSPWLPWLVLSLFAFSVLPQCCLLSLLSSHNSYSGLTYKRRTMFISIVGALGVLHLWPGWNKLRGHLEFSETCNNNNNNNSLMASCLKLPWLTVEGFEGSMKRSKQRAQPESGQLVPWLVLPEAVRTLQRGQLAHQITLMPKSCRGLKEK